MSTVDRFIEENFGKIQKKESVQELWSGYGEIERISIAENQPSSLIVKNISFPKPATHPKGWNTSFSHKRKLRSYEVEMCWYETYANELRSARVPKSYSTQKSSNNSFIIMEDLDSSGFNKRLDKANIEQMKPCLEWLARFHAHYLGRSPDGLWETGSYWHLKTRPEELEKTSCPRTRTTASLIDKKLLNSKFKTIIHGDAKLANFCFSKDLQLAAAVDYQYVGRGCGMRDLAYFVSSCLNSEDCLKHEAKVLSIYFKCLRDSIPQDSDIDINALEKEWRELYPYAWADFYRFLAGWSPNHWKLHSYSQAIATNVQEEVLTELTKVAAEAAHAAGRIIQDSKKFSIFKKNATSTASEVVTDVDFQAQESILRALSKTIVEFDFGVLSEELKDEKTRFIKDYFWCIDPLDGTLPFTKDLPGHAVSISLVDVYGTPIIGVVYDPVDDNIYHATISGGSFKNKEQIRLAQRENGRSILYADLSLKNEEKFSELCEKYEICFGAGAVMNSIYCLENAPATYLKLPKSSPGGGSIWDFAAVSLIINEAGGSATDYFGTPLDLNRKDSTFLNHRGILIKT